ncbi:hypothetical protein FOZ60_010730 [Perkinsus olseni]|uniref:Uncharacterized protein n=1 Tax=Perkinsus olseni TaxID=32597 RepID=A0A7J6NEK2_PEROL|nr:hypothetical protein FOZ60_010730 [Perkinsus olseni]
MSLTWGVGKERALNTLVSIMSKSSSMPSWRKRDALRALKRDASHCGYAFCETEYEIMSHLPNDKVVALSERWRNLLSAAGSSNRSSGPYLLGLAVRKADLSRVKTHCSRMGRYYALWCEANLRLCSSSRTPRQMEREVEIEVNVHDDGPIEPLSETIVTNIPGCSCSRDGSLLAGGETLEVETLESYLARHYKNMKEDYHGPVVERYSFFSHAVVEPLISDGAPHRKLIAALQDILDHEGEERARAAVRRGLSRGNKRRHKAICNALNRVCIHLDICRLLHLTLPRTSTELNERCTIQWEAAAEMYRAVAHELDSLHHVIAAQRIAMGIRTDGDLKAADIEVAPHPDIPLLPWDFWRWFVLSRALREIPFNELQDRCLKYLDLHLDNDDFEELQSRARLTRPREQEDRRHLLLETRLRAAEHSRKAQHKDGCDLSKPSSASRPEEGPVNQPVRELRDFVTSPPPKLRRGMLKNRYPVIPVQEDMKELLEYMRNQPMPSTEIKGAASHVEQEPSIAAEIDDSLFETPPPKVRILVPGTPTTIARRRCERANFAFDMNSVTDEARIPVSDTIEPCFQSNLEPEHADATDDFGGAFPRLELFPQVPEYEDKLITSDSETASPIIAT